jgi:transglutaminase-like putative cysteine protease
MRRAFLLALCGLSLACSSQAQPAPVLALPRAARGPSAKPAPELAPLDSSQFLAAISVEARPDLAPDELELSSRFSGSDFAELSLRHLLLRSEPGKLRVRGGAAYVASSEPVREQERSCSFVLDCDDPAVREALSELRARKAEPTAADVTAFVYEYISNKHMGRGFDIASVVAQRKEGDCTEHAVLTAALLRGVGIPSHVVTGIALFEIEGKPAAFGHAWVEYHDGQRWRLADATNLGEDAPKLSYVAIRQLRSEGPSYSRDLYSGFHLLDVESLGVPTR